MMKRPRMNSEMRYVEDTSIIWKHPGRKLVHPPSIEEIVRVSGLFAPTYQSRMRTHRNAIETVLKNMDKVSPIETGLAEIGCGPATNAGALIWEWYKRNINGIRTEKHTIKLPLVVICLDVTPSMLDMAKENITRQLTRLIEHAISETRRPDLRFRERELKVDKANINQKLTTIRLVQVKGAMELELVRVHVVLAEAKHLSKVPDAESVQKIVGAYIISAWAAGFEGKIAISRDLTRTLGRAKCDNREFWQLDESPLRIRRWIGASREELELAAQIERATTVLPLTECASLIERRSGGLKVMGDFISLAIDKQPYHDVHGIRYKVTAD